MTNISLNRYYLVPRPNALAGMAALFDFTGALSTYNYSATLEEADGLAVFTDWEAVGDDLSDAVDRMTSEMPPLNA